MIAWIHMIYCCFELNQLSLPYMYLCINSSISDVGTVVTGRVEQGAVKIGDKLRVLGIKAAQKTACEGEMMIIV